MKRLYYLLWRDRVKDLWKLFLRLTGKKIFDRSQSHVDKEYSSVWLSGGGIVGK